MQFKTILTALAVIAAGVALAVAPGTAAQETTQEPEPTPTAQPAQEPEPTYWQKRGCEKLVKGERYRRKLRSTYRFSARGGDYRAKPVTKGRRKLKRMRECSRNRRVHRNRIKSHRSRVESWRFHRRIDRATPFGEWAIPAYIVMCESGGNYRAQNPSSSASGAYQFLTSSWHANGGGRYASHAAAAPPWAQHLIAHYYYSRAGSSPWECA